MLFIAQRSVLTARAAIKKKKCQKPQPPLESPPQVLRMYPQEVLHTS